jgi:hypothetical protein
LSQITYVFFNIIVFHKLAGTVNRIRERLTKSVFAPCGIEIYAPTGAAFTDVIDIVLARTFTSM